MDRTETAQLKGWTISEKNILDSTILAKLKLEK
jgi:hypothetical protein